MDGSMEYMEDDSGSSNSSENDSRKVPKKKGVPYIPSYMDLTNGPEPCVVCGDAATGYHYRCMTCEGCKGFFRRTIQKDLVYQCKWNEQCIIEKVSRNQCQACRFRKCIAVGMTVDLVLNEKQRLAKRRLIEENRERRRMEHTYVKNRNDSLNEDVEPLSDDDKRLIEQVTTAYPYPMELDMSFIRADDGYGLLWEKLKYLNDNVWTYFVQIMTPLIVKIVEFAKSIPGYQALAVDDQLLLLKSCCLEVMCLRLACRYDTVRQAIVLPSGACLTQHNNISGIGEGDEQQNLATSPVTPLLELATSLSRLQLDNTEVALLAAVLLVRSDYPSLKDADGVEHLQDAILVTFKRYVSSKRPTQPLHWAKILMKITDIRTICARHAECFLTVPVQSPVDLPPLFLEMFTDGCHQ